MSMNGEPDGPPMKSNPFANDYVTALFALWSALAAYISAQRTGRGQVVDVAQYECQFKLLACGLMDYLELGQEHPRTGNSDPSGLQPYGIYPTRRGLHQHRGDRRPVPPAEGGRPRSRPGPSSGPSSTRSSTPTRSSSSVVAWLAERTADEAEQVLNAHDIPCSKVMTAPDIARHPHYRARDMIIEWDDDIGGRVQGTGFVPKFSGTPSRCGGGRRGAARTPTTYWPGWASTPTASPN